MVSKPIIESVEVESDAEDLSGVMLEEFDQLRLISRSSPPAITPARVRFVVDDRVAPHLLRGQAGEFDSRVVTITYHGAPMEYNLGDNQVRSSQLTLTKNVGELRATPLWVTINEEDIPRLCVNIKVHGVSL